MNRKNFFKLLGVALLATPLLSFKNKTKEKDCLDFDLSHYKYSDEQLTLGDKVMFKQRYYEILVTMPEGKLYYSKSVSSEGTVVNEFWSLYTKEFKQYHQINYKHKTVGKKFDDFNTGICREITVPIK